jgi:hypothetical protein
MWARGLGLLATLGAVAAGTVWEWQETGRVATVELQSYPGSDYVVQGTLALRELYAEPLYAVNITGLVSIVGEGSGDAGLHIHTGRDPSDAKTIGAHLFPPDSVQDPWDSSTVRRADRATMRASSRPKPCRDNRRGPLSVEEPRLLA